MNSERRHELQENELAVHLARINKAIEPYSKLIAVVVGAVVLGVIALALYQSKTSGDRSDATLALIEASQRQDPSDLAQIAASYPKTSAAAWAKLYEGNTLLAEAIQSLFVDRTTAEDSIRQARSAYNTAIAMSDDRIIRSRAHFGLARASEALGEIETAIREYEATELARESESMVALARRRIDSSGVAGDAIVCGMVRRARFLAGRSLAASFASLWFRASRTRPTSACPLSTKAWVGDDDSKPLADGGIEFPSGDAAMTEDAETDAEDAVAAKDSTEASASEASTSSGESTTSSGESTAAEDSASGDAPSLDETDSDTNDPDSDDE